MARVAYQGHRRAKVCRTKEAAHHVEGELRRDDGAQQGLHGADRDGGWKTERMMRRYAAVTDQTLRAAAEAVSGTEPCPTAPAAR